jgi:hypothetical protein
LFAMITSVEYNASSRARARMRVDLRELRACNTLSMPPSLLVLIKWRTRAPEGAESSRATRRTRSRARLAPRPPEQTRDHAARRNTHTHTHTPGRQRSCGECVGAPRYPSHPLRTHRAALLLLPAAQRSAAQRGAGLTGGNGGATHFQQRNDHNGQQEPGLRASVSVAHRGGHRRARGPVAGCSTPTQMAGRRVGAWT